MVFRSDNPAAERRIIAPAEVICLFVTVMRHAALWPQVDYSKHKVGRPKEIFSERINNQNEDGFHAGQVFFFLRTVQEIKKNKL